MRRILSVLAVAAAVWMTAGCRQTAPSVEGRVIDATIHSVTVETPAGDSLSVSTLGTDPMSVPGVLPGDFVRIFYETLSDGETMRALQLDIEEPSAYRLLPGIWRDCAGADEVGLVLAEDGSSFRNEKKLLLPRVSRAFRSSGWKMTAAAISATWATDWTI